MHAPAPNHLTCLSCGYDLRAAGEAARCPECGFAVRDSVAGHTRAAERWAWKVRAGMLLMLIATPLLVASMLTASEVSYALLLNLPAPKLWSSPIVIMYRGIEQHVVAILASILLNTFGIFLLTTPDRRYEAAMSLRRWLRVYAVAAVTATWFTVAPQFRSIWLSGGGRFDELFVLLVAEIPGTTLFYLYLARVARDRLRDPQLARRALVVLRGGLPLQVFSAAVWSGLLPIQGFVVPVVFIAYGVTVVCVGLLAVDFCLDLYRALGRIERDDPPR